MKKFMLRVMPIVLVAVFIVTCPVLAKTAAEIENLAGGNGVDNVNTAVNSTFGSDHANISAGCCVGCRISARPDNADNGHPHLRGYRIQSIGAGCITGDYNGLHLFCL